MNSRALGIVLLLAGIFLVSPAPDCSAISEAAARGIIESGGFTIAPRPDYEGHYWLIRFDGTDRVGYAKWDPVNRRYRLFTPGDYYMGFLQATVGRDFDREAIKQFTWYDRNNRYQGIFIREPGSDPRTLRNTQGQLGGTLRHYRIGVPPGIDTEVGDSAIPWILRESGADR